MGGFGHLEKMGGAQLSQGEGGRSRGSPGVCRSACFWLWLEQKGLGAGRGASLRMRGHWDRRRVLSWEGWKVWPCPLPPFPREAPGLRLTASPLFPSPLAASDILSYYFLCNQAVSNPFQQVRAAGKGTGWRRARLGPRLRDPGGG